MALKHFNPTSPGRRALVLVDRSELHKGRPEKSLVEGLTARRPLQQWPRHRPLPRRRREEALPPGGLQRRKWGVAGKVERLEYDPNRPLIALIKYDDGELAYILAPQRLKVGDNVIADEKTDVKPGNAMPLRSMPVGTIIHTSS